MSCNTAPSGASNGLVIDIEDGGSTILNAAEELDGSATAEITTFASAADSYDIDKGDLFTVDFDQVGDISAGVGVKIDVYGYWR